MKNEKRKIEYVIKKKQDEMAENIKVELLKKAETQHQRNVIKETINAIKKQHSLDTFK